MLKYSITFTGAAKMEMLGVVNREVMPLLHQAVKAVAQQTRADWQEAVHKAKLWSGEKDAYAQSITWRMTGDFSAVIETDYKHAEEIETGRPARDLKKMLDTSSKVRRTDKGKRFLVIPFRHNTPGNNAHSAAMPSSVHAMAKTMKPSKVLSVGQRPSGEVTKLSPKTGMQASAKQSPYLSNPLTKSAATVAKRNYQWGGRLAAGALKNAGLDAAQAKRYAGMVKMQTSTPGGTKSSAYLTFRVMMEGSAGWVIQPQPGQFLAKNVTQKMEPKAQAAFAEAVRRMVSG